MSKITALIPTYNNESELSELLLSLRWVDTILIVDSFSSDDTVSIAENLGAKVVKNRYLNQAEQSNFALQFVTTEWVLQLDTDELLEEGAEKEILDSIANCPLQVDCFRFRRKNHMLGKWIRYGGIYPDWENRLFRANKGKWFDREVHSNIRVPGEYRFLKSHIIHNGMPNISKQVKNLDRYTRYEADELKKKGKKFSYIKWLVFPLLVFIHKYLWLQGFRDGWRGFFLARYAAYYYFLSHSKFKEMEIMNLDKSPK